MGYKDNIDHGDVPGYGAIFMSNSGTKKECFKRKLFGLPLAQSNFVLNVKKGMILFLFEFEKRQLHGVFRATSDGEIDIQPHAFRSSGKWFPAQVSFTSVWNCMPLAEHEFKDAIRDNYFSSKKFNFGLSKNQVYELMMLFRSKRISKNNTPRTFLRYDDKPTHRDTRYGDNRKKIRDRIKFIEDDDHGFDIDEYKEVDDHGYRSPLKKRAHKYYKKGSLTSCMKERDEFFRDHAIRKSDKWGLRRVHDANLHFRNENEMHNNFPEITKSKKIKIKGEHYIQWRFRKSSVASNDEDFLVDKKNKYYRDDNGIQDEYHAINGFRQNHSALNSPDGGSEMGVNGWCFRQGTVESQTLNDHPLSQNHNYESRRADFGVKLGSDEKFDLGNAAHDSLFHCNQKNSDFIPISEASEQFQRLFEFDNIENPSERGFSDSTSCDPSMITVHTPYDPEVPDFIHKPYDPDVPDFCHKPSYFAPGPGSSPVDNCPISPNETIPFHTKNKSADLEKSKYVPKISVFDRLNLVPKSLHHEQEHESDEKGELDVSVNEVMKVLEKIVSGPIKRTEKSQSNFKQDDDDNITHCKIVDCELPKIESDVNIECERVEGDESVIQETRVVDFKRCKKAKKNFDDEMVKESTDVVPTCKRRKLVRPVFVKKESTVANETTSLKDDCGLRKASGSVENIEGEKGGVKGEVCVQVEENGNVENCEVLEKQWQEEWGFADSVRVDCLYDDKKMCGWLEE